MYFIVKWLILTFWIYCCSIHPLRTDQFYHCNQMAQIENKKKKTKPKPKYSKSFVAYKGGKRVLCEFFKILLTSWQSFSHRFLILHHIFHRQFTWYGWTCMIMGSCFTLDRSKWYRKVLFSLLPTMTVARMSFLSDSI